MEGATCGTARRYRGDGDYAGHPEDTWGFDGNLHHNDNGPVAGVDWPGESGALAAANSSTLSIDTKHDFNVKLAVKAWINGDYDNEGFYVSIGGTSQYVGFHSNEATNVAYRPILTVEYVPEPATVALLLLGVPALVRRRRG